MWEIFAYDDADALFGIFNVIAAITGSGNYASSLAAVAFCGFVTALFAYAFTPERLQGWQWLATVMLVYSVLLLPKVSVGIVDKTGGTPERIVDHVPFGVAVIGGITSSIGNGVTEWTETGFQSIPGPDSLPSELTYQRNGLLFGNRVVRQTRLATFLDPAFRVDLINFVDNCTLYDLLDGTVNLETFATSGDVWPLMATPNPARFTPITRGPGLSDIATCPEAYAFLSDRMPTQLTAVQFRFALQLNPTLRPAAAASVVSDQIQQAYFRNFIADGAATSTDILRQNAMLNVIHDAGNMQCQRINDPSCATLAMGRAAAIAQTNASWINAGKIAESALPLFRNVVEAIIYAVFPLVILMLMLSHGQEAASMFRGYVLLLIWIQLWPPLYAILNYIATVFAAHELRAAADVGGSSALALRTVSGIYSTTISTEGIVGYVMLSVPAISWYLVRRFESFGAALIGGLGALQGTVSASSGASATGNVNMGNVTMDHIDLGPQRTSPFFASKTDIYGTSSVDLRDGTARFQQNMSHLATGFAFTAKEATSLSEEARKLESFALTEKESAAESRASALITALGIQTQFARSYEQAGGSRVEHLGREQTDIEKLESVATQVNERLGLDKEAGAGKVIAARIAAGAELAIRNSASVGLKVPLTETGAKSEVTATASGRAEVSFEGHTFSQSRFRDAVDFARSSISQSGIKVGAGVTDAFSATRAYQWGRRSQTSNTSAFDSQFRTATEHQVAADRAYMNAQQIGRAAQFLREAAENVNGDASNYLYQRLLKTGEWETYLRAAPQRQMQMTYDIAREYARGGLGLNGNFIPRSLLESPNAPSHLPTPNLLGIDSNIHKTYQESSLPANVSDLDRKYTTNTKTYRYRPAKTKSGANSIVTDNVSGVVDEKLRQLDSRLAKTQTGTIAKQNEIHQRYSDNTNTAAAKSLGGHLANYLSNGLINQVVSGDNTKSNRLQEGKIGHQEHKKPEDSQQPNDGEGKNSN